MQEMLRTMRLKDSQFCLAIFFIGVCGADVNNPQIVSKDQKNICDRQVCPEGLNPFSGFFGQYCHTLTKPQQFPPQCPYPLFLSVEDSRVGDLYSGFKNITVWIMAKRIFEGDYFAPFEWISKDDKHGQPIFDYFQTNKNIAQKNCLGIFNYSYKPVPCDERLPALCIYPNHLPYINKYCQKHYENDYLTCVPDSINIVNHNCYCETARGEARNSFCNKLAEPLTPHQNYLLIHILNTIHDVCWIGFYQNESRIPRWVSSNSTLDYDCWAKDANREKPFGAMQFSINPGLTFEEDYGTLTSAICELQNLYDKNVSIQLKLNPTSNMIEVRIKNPLEITDYYNRHYEMYCFAGPTMDGVNQRVSELLEDFEDQDPWIGHFVNFWSHPIYYWCEAYQQPDLRVVYSNKILVPGSLGGYEYAIGMKIRTEEDKDPYLDAYLLIIRDNISEQIRLQYINILGILKVLNYSQEASSVELILHLSTTGYKGTEEDEYHNLHLLLSKIASEDINILNLNYFGRSDVCLPESSDLFWPKTIIGGVTLPREICLQADSTPVMRKCNGDFLRGGFWSNIIGECTNKELPERSKQLHELLTQENLTASELTTNLSMITSDNQDVLAVDIYLISQLLEKLETSQEDLNISEIVTIISNVMNFNLDELGKAQAILNCTDNILDSLDQILGKLDGDTQLFGSKNLLVHASDLRTSHIVGVALKGNASDGFETSQIIPIFENTINETLLNLNEFELVAYLPPNLIREIINCISPNLPIKILMILFHNDALFNENHHEMRQSNSRILNILIPDFYCSFRTPIQVIFQPLYPNDFKQKCAFWRFGAFEGNNIQGSWAEEMIPEVPKNYTNAVCGFDHVTHFALLMMGKLTKEMSETHVIILDVISAIGTALSLLSILSIFVMAISSKSWRGRASNKILLNFSVAIALQMILLYVGNNLNQDGVWCVIIGASLHYTVLSEFLWMLIIGFLQYRKFVTVFHQQTPNLVGKTCTIAWCLPIIPIILLLGFASNAYKTNDYGLCYPSDGYFYLAVVLPISIIVLINIVIFVKIIFAICWRKIEVYGAKDEEGRLQCFLAFFLFFVLGISWIFGVILSLGGGVVFSYLFCVTATFQGLVMFLFFVVMNDNSRKVWRGSNDLKRQTKRNSNSSSSQTQETEGLGSRYF